MSKRTALVTGSAQGIGLAIAEALRAANHRVLGVDIRDQPEGSVDQAFQRRPLRPGRDRASAR